MAPEHLLEDRDGSQAGRHLQHRYDLSGKNVGKGVRTTASAHPLLLHGHRSIDTTDIYVKVALPQLTDVALPFPGGAS